SLLYPAPPSSPLFPYTTLFRSWCVPCNDEQPGAKLLGEMYKPQGVHQFDVLVEGGTRGAPATNLDVDKWASKFTLDVPIAIDPEDRKSTRLNSSHVKISYAVFC